MKRGALLDDYQQKIFEPVDAIDKADKLQFPENGSPDKVTITRKREFPAWVGRPDRLIRVATYVEDSLRRAFEEARPDLEALSGYLRTSRIKEFAPGTRVQGGTLERRGDLATIISEMDAGEIKWVELGNGRASRIGNGTPSVSVTFGRDPRYKTLGGGVSVEVTGSDKQWVAATYDTLVNELVKGVPWWARLITNRAYFGYMVLCYIMVMSIALKWLRPFEPITGVVLGVAVAGLAWGTHSATKWLLPDFELVEPGERPRARRVGTFLVVLIGLVSGIVTIWAYFRP